MSLFRTSCYDIDLYYKHLPYIFKRLQKTFFQALGFFIIHLRAFTT